MTEAEYKAIIKTHEQKIRSDALIIAEQQETIDQLRSQIAHPADPVDDGVE